MLGLVLDYSLRASFWLCQKSYDGAVYLYYGKQETNEERILRELKELKSENKELQDQLQLLLVNNSSETKKDVHKNVVEADIVVNEESTDIQLDDIQFSDDENNDNDESTSTSDESALNEPMKLDLSEIVNLLSLRLETKENILEKASNLYVYTNWGASQKCMKFTVKYHYEDNLVKVTHTTRPDEWYPTSYVRVYKKENTNYDAAIYKSSFSIIEKFQAFEYNKVTEEYLLQDFIAEEREELINEREELILGMMILGYFFLIDFRQYHQSYKPKINWSKLSSLPAVVKIRDLINTDEEGEPNRYV